MGLFEDGPLTGVTEKERELFNGEELCGARYGVDVLAPSASALEFTVRGSKVAGVNGIRNHFKALSPPPPD